jgi:hypothetical protein
MCSDLISATIVMDVVRHKSKFSACETIEGFLIIISPNIIAERRYKPDIKRHKPAKKNYFIDIQEITYYATSICMRKIRGQLR